MKAAKQRDFNEAIDEAVASIEANSKKTIKPSINPRRKEEIEQNILKNILSYHRKFSSFIRQVDGFKDGGVMWELLTRPMNEAANKEAIMSEQATKKLNEIFSVYSSTEMGFSTPKYLKGIPSIQTGLFKKQFIPEINDSLTKEEMLVIAFNWGNFDSRQKTMDGRNWTQDQVESILDRLDERDIKFVQSIWDFLDSYWAESKAISERVTGIAPEKIKAMPWKTKYGTFRGGYYPLKYGDKELFNSKPYQNSVKEQADQAMKGASIYATTKHGHRENRIEGVKRPIRLDFGVLFEHISEKARPNPKVISNRSDRSVNSTI